MSVSNRRSRSLAALLALAGVLVSPLAAQSGSAAATGSTAAFRGLSLASDGTIWVSGTEGTVLRSTDGGAHWEPRPIAEASSFDLRDVEGVSATTAYALVAGGDTGRIYKTTDGGATWVRQYDDTRKGIFLDGFAFWDESRGVAVGDPMDGKFVILRTEDGGAHWTQVPPAEAPSAMREEGMFAASGTLITVGPGGRAWIGTGGNLDTKVARVLRSTDYGRTWVAGETPIPAGTGSTGIFSLAFVDSLRGIAVGGDYGAPEADRHNVAMTADGGKTWRLGDTTGATGYLSAVAYMAGTDAKVVVAAGTPGTFLSRDGGVTWARLNATSYNTVVAAKRRKSTTAIVAAGEGGVVAVWPSVAAATDSAVRPLARSANASPGR